jgi:hypothetical protein
LPLADTVHLAWTHGKEVVVKKLIALAITVAVIAASLFVLPTVESGPSNLFSRVGHAEGEGGGD